MQKPMMSIVIIEDDPLSSDLLVALLQENRDDLQIKAVLRSVKEAIQFLKTDTNTDLILSDIQLPDGLSFSIFESVTIQCPIIFISAYDKYILNAFEYSGIDYLVKPVSAEGLDNALKKYKALEKHFTNNSTVLKGFLNEFLVNRKTRIIVKKGLSNISLNLTDVVLFYTESLVVYVIDNKGNKYIIDKSLNHLENELDSRMFFRANRQYIININYVQGFKTYERVKLMVTLNLKEVDHLLVVGQEKARHFRQWLSES